VLKVHIEATHSTWKSGSIYYPPRHERNSPPPPTPSPGDPAITFTVRVKNITGQPLDLTIASYEAAFYDVEVLSPDGTLFWRFGSRLSLLGIFTSLPFSPGEEKVYQVQWDLKGNCPEGTVRERLFGDCPDVKAPPGVYEAIGSVEYFPDPNAHPPERKTIQSQPLTFEITS
jgi:hypothetical protein